MFTFTPVLKGCISCDNYISATHPHMRCESVSRVPCLFGHIGRMEASCHVSAPDFLRANYTTSDNYSGLKRPGTTGARGPSPGCSRAQRQRPSQLGSGYHCPAPTKQLERCLFGFPISEGGRVRGSWVMVGIAFVALPPPSAAELRAKNPNGKQKTEKDDSRVCRLLCNFHLTCRS